MIATKLVLKFHLLTAIQLEGLATGPKSSRAKKSSTDGPTPVAVLFKESRVTQVTTKLARYSEEPSNFDYVL